MSIKPLNPELGKKAVYAKPELTELNSQETASGTGTTAEMMATGGNMARKPFQTS